MTHKFIYPDDVASNPSSVDDQALLSRINPIFSGKQPPVENELCSILIPLHEPFLTLLKEYLQPCLEEVGFTVMKADDLFTQLSRPIVDDIWRLINRSRLLVADVTGKNPNVFYELGIAHTVGKDVIIITQNEDDVPFDLRHLRYFPYKDDDQGKKN